MHRPLKILTLLPLGLACLTASICGDEEPTGLEDAAAFDVTLVNLADEAIHIIVPGEDFGPANRLEAGAGRTVGTSGIHGRPVRFLAGRNIGLPDEVLVSVECTFRIREDGEIGEGRQVGYFEVSAPALVCQNWE